MTSALQTRARQAFSDLKLDLLPEALRRRSDRHYYLSIWPPLTDMVEHGDRDYPVYPEKVTSLYVHTPFCSGACTFCNYYFQVVDPNIRRKRIGEFLATLRQEISLHAERAQIAASYLYFGGGTPSLIPADLLAGFLDWIETAGIVVEPRWATIEIHPELFDDIGAATAFLSLCKAKGISRVSLGIQDLDEEVLAGTNRRHGAAIYEQALQLVRKEGLLFNLDLIYGLPGQSKSGWERSLRFAVDQGADSVSVYFLFLNGRTALGQRAASGKTALPGYRLNQELHLMARMHLEENGYVELPSDFFCRCEAPPLKDRVLLPSDSHTLPLGPGSYGYFGGTQFVNYFSEEAWRSAILSGSRPIWRSHRHSADELFRRDLMFSIKNSLGLNGETIRAAWGDALSGMIPMLDSLEKQGLVAPDPAGFLLTPKGRLCAEEIACLFAPPAPLLANAGRSSDQVALRHSFAPTYG